MSKGRSKRVDIYIVGDKQFLSEFKAEEYNKRTGGKYFRTKMSWMLYYGVERKKKFNKE